MKRLNWIDLLRRFAMILVVIGHSNISGTFLNKWIFSFHMPLFFFISGLTYGMRPIGNEISSPAYIRKKARDLLFPYFFWSIALIPVAWFTRCYLGGGGFDLQKLLIGTLYSNHAVGHPGSANNALWFLPTTFLLVILFRFCEQWAQGNEKYLTLIILMLFNLGLAENRTYDIREPWHIRTALVALIFYYAGYLFTRHLAKIISCITPFIEKAYQLLFICILLFSVGTYTVQENSRVSMHGNKYGSIVLFLTLKPHFLRNRSIPRVCRIS